MKPVVIVALAGLLIYQPSISAKQGAAQYSPISQLNTSISFRQQTRKKFLRNMDSKCPPIFSAQQCRCVSGMMFDELTPVQQALIGEGFLFAQQYPDKSEQEIGKMIEAKYGANNLQKKDIHVRWQKAQLKAFHSCKLPF